MSISDKCLLIDVDISCWDGYKLDRAASEKVVEEAGANDKRAARVNKSLLPKTALAKVVAARNAIRAHIKVHTLPWRDRGARILMRNMYPIFMQGYGALERQFKNEVKDFITNLYPNARDQASFRMGDLFNPDDYPTPIELCGYFSVKLSIEGITEPNDFRVKLADEAAQEVRESMEETLRERLAEAMGDVYRRLSDTLQHYIATIGTEEKVFRDSTVNNLIELVDLLPGLNITNDLELRAIRDRIRETIYQYAPDDLRKDAAARAQAAAEAQTIFDKMRGLMGVSSQ